MRRLIWLLVAAGVLVAAFVALLPWLASTQIVRDRIALEMSVWSGYRVELGSDPVIEIWPVFRARMTDVRLWQWDGEDDPVVQADLVEADLSALAALRGNILFTNLRLIRPSARISREGFNFSMPPSQGRFAQAIAFATALVRANPDDPDISALPDDSLGSLEIVDGRLTVDEGSAQREVLSSFAGKLVWPALNRPASATLSGIWRGEVVSAELQSGQPLVLMAGGTAPIDLRVRSAPMDLDFTGRANLASGSYLEGEIDFSSTSLRRMLEWSRSDMAGSASVGAMTLQGSVSGTNERVKIDDAVLALDGNPGRGTLEVVLGPGLPSIAGTLAFETVDLASLLAAFSNVTADNWARRGRVESNVSRHLSVDLRVSANRAKAGTIALTDVAATAQVRGGLAAFDISDSTAFGGMLQAGIRIDGGTGDSQVEMRMRAEDIDMGALAKAVSATHMVPISRGDVAVSLKGRGMNWYDVLRTAEGSFSAAFGPGAMAGVDLPAFLERSRKGDFFALSEAGGGSISFQGLDVKMTVDRGIASVDRFEMRGERDLITLDGLVPLAGRGLALQGHIEPTSPAPTAADASRGTAFFVGGSWDAPFISPIVSP